MRQQIQPDKLATDLLQLAKESAGYRDLLSRFGSYMKAAFGVDEAIVKDPPKDSSLAPVDEVALNTGQPYIDNGLSGYSAFADLIEYNNKGFRCCAIIPVAKDGRQFGTVTLLARGENAFPQGVSGLLSLAASIMSSEVGSRHEREKSLSMARYFDASFNNMMPQLLVDSSWGIVKANKQAMNRFDRSLKEMSNAKLTDIFSVGDQALQALWKGSLVEAAEAGSKGSIFEISSARISEGLAHIAINEVSRIRDADSKMKMLELAGSEVFVITDKDFEILWISNSYPLLGMEADMLVGRKFTDFVSSPSAVKDLLNGLSNNRYSGQIRLNFGNDFELYGKLAAYRSGDEFHMIVSRDYDRYVKSAERLAEDIIELSNDPMIEIDGSGYITSYNRSAEALFRLSREAIGTPVYSMCADEESQSKLVASLSIAKGNGKIENVYVSMLECKDRREIPCVQTIKAIADQNGNASRFLIMNRELETRNRMEEMEQQMERLGREVEKLRTESDLKSQFIQNISHDLKTPITNIMGYSKLLLTDGSDTLTKEQIEYIQIIHAESERFMVLVKQILDVAKLSSGIVKLDLQQVNFNEIKENPSIKALAEACANKGLEFSWTVDYNVPEITADPNRLIQIFSNLITNAIKFTENGSVRVKVMRKKGSVRVEVADTGIGMSKEDRSKIFKKFYQLRRGLVKQEGSGTGLGLSIAREIVSLHGGKISVDSDVGKGSTFWFTMPISPKIKKKALKYNRAEHQTP